MPKRKTLTITLTEPQVEALMGIISTGQEEMCHYLNNGDMTIRLNLRRPSKPDFTCDVCRHLGARTRKDSVTPWEEAYCNHESLDPGDGAMGIKRGQASIPPSWCPLRSNP